MLIPVMLSGPADPEFDADADAVPDHPNFRSDGSLHRDPESGVCVGGAGAVASFTATAFELCRCGLVDEMDELPAHGSDSTRLFLVVVQPVQRAEM